MVRCSFFASETDRLTTTSITPPYRLTQAARNRPSLRVRSPARSQRRTTKLGSTLSVLSEPRLRQVSGAQRHDRANLLRHGNARRGDQRARRLPPAEQRLYLCHLPGAHPDERSVTDHELVKAQRLIATPVLVPIGTGSPPTGNGLPSAATSRGRPIANSSPAAVAIAVVSAFPASPLASCRGLGQSFAEKQRPPVAGRRRRQFGSHAEIRSPRSARSTCRASRSARSRALRAILAA